MTRRTFALLAIAIPVAAGIAAILYVPDTPSPPDGPITVVDSIGRIVPDAARAPDRPAATAGRAPAIKAMIEEAPPLLKAMHTGIENERDIDSLVDERRVTDLFAGNPQFAGQPVAVSCTRLRCEVHGSSAADEDVTRLAIRDGDFLDRVSAAGYSSGIDMVSGRPGGSEFIVYLESGAPAPR